MKRMSESEIMSATKPWDIFTRDLEVIEQEKECYLESFKPKEYRTLHNFVVTKRIILLYNQAIDEINNKSISASSDCIRSKSGEEYNLHCVNYSTSKMGKTYVTTKYVIYVVNSFNKKYYENYIRKTQRYSKPDRTIWETVKYMLPNVERHFETDDGNFAIFVKKPCEMYSLKEILDYFDGSLRPEHVASIVNRLYYFVCYMSLVEMNHNAITLENLYFAPGRKLENGESYTVNDMRILGVFGGWFFTTYYEEQLLGVPKEVYEIMPRQNKDSGYSSYKVDELSIKKLAKELLGSKISDAPKPLVTWFNNTSIAKDSYEEFRNWDKVVAEAFGKRRFVEMDVSI